MSAWTVRLERTSGGQRSTTGDEPGGHAGTFVIEDSLGYLVNRAARTFAHRLAMEIRPAGVGIGQWAVLMFLWARDGMSQAELSRLVAIEPPTMVRTVDRMVRDGLVTRTPDPKDGRAVLIHLTERGLALRDELVPRAIAVNEAAVSNLNAREAAMLPGILRKLSSP